MSLDVVACQQREARPPIGREWLIESRADLGEPFSVVRNRLIGVLQQRVELLELVSLDSVGRPPLALFDL